MHAKNKPIGDDVDLEQIARITSGFTGADLETYLMRLLFLQQKQESIFLHRLKLIRQ